jgi:CheY-like chemotaxis protein
MINRKFHFIVIDDSELDCYIAERLIQHTGKCETILKFTDADAALKYIAKAKLKKTVILLDVLMPLMNGFEFVEAFEQLPKELQANYTIIALTTSLSRNDIIKIKGYRSVAHFIDKPIAPEKLLPVLDQVEMTTDSAW